MVDSKLRMAKGILFWTLLGLPATLGVIFMLIPLLPLMVISPVSFRGITDYFITFYFIYVTGTIELLYGIRIIVSGDKIVSSDANNLIIMNHRTRLDWMFFWCCLWRQSYSNLEKQIITLKYPLKYIPGLGWATQFAAFIFMRRNFDEDKKIISSMLDYYRRVNRNVNIVYFPEGTDKCPNGTKRSHAFADKNNLSRYEFVLHPRVTGFSYITDKMRHRGQFDSLYDVSVAYNYCIPQDEVAIVKGEFPDEVHFHIRRYEAQSLPASDSELQDFCRERWSEKETELSEFYDEDSLKFVEPHSDGWSDSCTSPRRYIQALTFLYWIPFTLLTMYYIITSTLVLTYTCFGVVSMMSVGFLAGGLDILQTKFG